MSHPLFQVASAVDRLARAGLLVGANLPANGRLGPQTTPDRLLATRGGFLGAGLDSRSLEPHQLFVALAGENVDGRNFIPSVLAKGHWVLAEADRDGDDPYTSLSAAAGAGVLISQDPGAALASLAGAWRSRWAATVAGVTGTNGKTTTKDLLAAMLSGAGRTLATAGNLNNRLGQPLTLLGLRADHEFAVIEMGASAVGDIAALAPLAAPHVGIITNAAPAHLAEFGSLADIIQGKGELLDSLPVDGSAVLNADSPGFDAWSDRSPCQVVSFGKSHGTHRWSWAPGSGQQEPQVTLDGVAWDVPLPGEHNGANLVAALLAARSLGVADEKIRTGLGNFAGSPHRGVLLVMGGRMVLDDSYNANPGSVRAACRSLGRLAEKGLRIGVLGAMAEMGPDSDAIHENTGRELASEDLDILVAVGKNARLLSEGFDAGGGEGHYCATFEEAAAWLATRTEAGDRLLIKGSRSAGMEGMLPLLEQAFSED